MGGGGGGRGEILGAASWFYEEKVEWLLDTFFFTDNVINTLGFGR